MLGFLSNRATAAHLALAAVAPLVLCKYFSGDAVCSVLPWIAFICVIWAFMAPVLRGEERSPDSRYRLLHDSASDPFLWVAVALLVYSAVIALNSGVALSFDPEAKMWKLLSPAVPVLPGGVRGSGGECFTSSLLVLSLYPAVAYSLDSRQSVYFVVFASLVAVLDAAYAYASGIGLRSESAVAYGLWALAAAAAMFSAECSRRRVKEMLSMLVLSGCLAELMLSCSAVELWVFTAAISLLALIFIAFRCRELRWIGVTRAFLMLLVSVGIASALFQWRSADWESLIPVLETDADAIFNRFAVEAWQSSPWTGSGVGSFPLVAKFGAKAEDWMILGAMPDFYSNGWRAFLVERGMIGVLAIACAIGAMLFSWFRYAWRRGFENFSAAVPLLPLAVAAVSAAMFFDGSAMRSEAIVAFVGIAAFSVNGGQ